MKNFSNDAYYQLFSVLASRIRLAIIDILMDGPKSLSECSLALEQNEDAMLKNIEQLVHCALVNVKRSENERIYSLNREIFEPLSELLEFHVSKYCPEKNKCIS